MLTRSFRASYDMSRLREAALSAKAGGSSRRDEQILQLRQMIPKTLSGLSNCVDVVPQLDQDDEMRKLSTGGDAVEAVIGPFMVKI